MSAPSGDPPPLVFPVFFVTGGLGLHTTTATADEHSLWIRTLAKPLRGARVTAGLYLGHAHDPLASIGWITEVSEPEADPLHAGFRAEFTDIDPEAIERILSLRNRSLTQFTRQRRYKTRLRVVTAEDGPRLATQLSRTGLFLNADDPPREGVALQLRVDLPDGQPSMTTAGLVVRRVTPYDAVTTGAPPGAGVQFVDATGQFRSRLDRYVERLASAA